jgi:hypothetical protein
MVALDLRRKDVIAGVQLLDDGSPERVVMCNEATM